MHVIEPAQFKTLPKHHKTRKKLLWLFCFVIVSTFVYGVLLYTRPLPPVSAQKVTISLPSVQTVQLQWPGYGQGALGADGFGLIATNGAQTPVPTASTAKLITALAILKQKPIPSGQFGPTITLDYQDVGLYQDYYLRGGSVVAVQDGEKLTEYQALQALLLPSANNMADSLARWAFGSVDNYTKYANQMVASLGMNNTHVADASGFSPDTKSTATDLVTLALAALKEPIIMQIAGQKEATIPVEGIITNVNMLLGEEGIIGLKTGNTDEAGGCFIFAASHEVAPNQKVTIVGAVMGAPSLGSALRDSLSLLKSSYSGFQSTIAMRKDQSVATYQTAWGNGATAVLAQDVSVVSWVGRPMSAKTVLHDITAPAQKDQQTAEVKLQVNGDDKTVKAYLNQTLAGPSLWWRLTRPSN